MSSRIKLIVINFFFVTLYFLSTANAQVSLFEDGSGEAAFKVNNSSGLFLNFQENAIKLNFSSFRKTDGETYWYTNKEAFLKSDDYDEDNNSYKDSYISSKKTIESVPRSVYLEDTSDTLEVEQETKAYRIITRDKIPNFFGVNLKAKANSGVSNLFDEGQFDPAGEMIFYYYLYGNKDENIDKKYDYFVFSGGIQLETVSLIDTTNFSNGLNAESSLGGTFEIAYNKVNREKNTIQGVGVSFDVGDNSDELVSQKYQVTTQIETSPNQSITSVNSLSGLLENDYVGRMYALNINADWGKYPKWNNRLLFAAHLRAKSIEFENLVPNLGGGVYITELGDSTTILGGINFLFEDSFGIEVSGPLTDRLTINLVTGFKF